MKKSRFDEHYLYKIVLCRTFPPLQRSYGMHGIGTVSLLAATTMTSSREDQ